METLEQRVEQLENRFRMVEDKLAQQAETVAQQKRGWRWFVGIFSDSPDFDDVVRIGQEWRSQDSPNTHDDNEE
jgi:hypothetical protein